jgi:hypothetical protein
MNTLTAAWSARASGDVKEHSGDTCAVAELPNSARAESLHLPSSGTVGASFPPPFSLQASPVAPTRLSDGLVKLPEAGLVLACQGLQALLDDWRWIDNVRHRFSIAHRRRDKSRIVRRPLRTLG